MPSSRYIDLTLGASGATYTAPADGYIDIRCGGSNGAFVKVTADVENMPVVNNNSVASLFVPVRKNSTFIIEYTTTTVYIFRFLYAVGSEPVA